ncbi:MAG: hypothetical protein RR523_01835 [Cetobacterium sp.]
MKKIFCINLLTLYFILFIICLFNYLVDPENIFKKYTELKPLIKERSNIGVNFNIDERKFKGFLLENTHNIDTLIVGSSRIMILNDSFFDNQKIFNAGVSGAGLEDQMAFIDIYRNKFNSLPKKIILGIDPWAFNLNSDVRYKSIEDNYLSLKKDISGMNNSIDINKIIDKYKTLATYSYLRDSFNFFKKNNFTIPKLNFTKIPDDNLDIFKGNIYLANDYSLLYSKEYRENNYGQVWNDSIHYQIYGFDKINPTLKNEFENLINFLLKKKTEIIIFLAPYSPNSYSEYEKNYPHYYNLLNNIENYLTKIANNSDNISLIGSYNPYKFNLKQTDFYDGMHLRRSKLSNILE